MSLENTPKGSLSEGSDHKGSHHQSVVHSEPQIGGHGTDFEGVDASVKLVLGSLGAIALTLVITAIVTIPIQNLLRDSHSLGKQASPLSRQGRDFGGSVNNLPSSYQVPPVARPTIQGEIRKNAK
jgi:hypothetical protein